MKLQFKYQPFQAEAAAAVCDVFNGQPYRTTTYRMDLGNMNNVQQDVYMTDTGFRNHPLVPALTRDKLLNNLIAVQRRNGIFPQPRNPPRFCGGLAGRKGLGRGPARRSLPGFPGWDGTCPVGASHPAIDLLWRQRRNADEPTHRHDRLRRWRRERAF